ncbi:MAG: hypothetical protein Q4F60_01375 [Candidatus Saccharibacteria bacterium]|nr:hypothetical protein [Candidatus Saccharibacteria bacterium]
MEPSKKPTAQSSSVGANINNGIGDAEKGKTTEKIPKPVYYIESPDDDTVLIGINVAINHNKAGENDIYIVRWYDTVRERIMIASEIRKNDDYFAFKRLEQEGGGFYYFMPMNLEIYNNKVKQRLAIQKDFTNENDLINAFLSSIED